MALTMSSSERPVFSSTCAEARKMDCPCSSSPSVIKILKSDIQIFYRLSRKPVNFSYGLVDRNSKTQLMQYSVLVHGLLGLDRTYPSFTDEPLCLCHPYPRSGFFQSFEKTIAFTMDYS